MSPSLFASGTTSSFHSRRSSQTSVLQPPYSPTTPRLSLSRPNRSSSSRLSIGSNISAGLTSNAGLGNLADELEDAWDEEDGLDASSFLSSLHEGDPDTTHSPVEINGSHAFAIPMSPHSPRVASNQLELPDKPPSPSKQWASMGMHRKTESLYDGSDHGPSSEDEAFDTITPTLQRRIHDIEEITRISNNADALSESGGVIPRTISALRDDLGMQSATESGITRLVTAYTSMSTHRTHQIREVMNASHPLMSNTSFASAISVLPLETIDLLIVEIDSLIATLPFISQSLTTAQPSDPLAVLQGLATQTCDFFTTLQSLTDTLTEHRQHLLAATRKLKNVRDLVDDLTMEEGLVETSMLLIQAGDWDRRCRERQAAKVVGEVLEGFKKTWDVDYVEGGWRPGTEPRREMAVR